jgi:hypothetical protein
MKTRTLTLTLLSLSLTLTLAAIAACGGDPKPVDPRYPPRAANCDVQIFQDVPPMKTDNLGPVNATCGEDIAKDDCLRTLKDQACKLGGDIVWGVADPPEKKDGKIRFSGRAAHTKAK